MAKKQLKKINQPKKYLQGGSNMGSVAMMRQNPYYLGQVEQDAAESKLEETRQQAMDVRQTAVQAKKDAEVQQKAALDQSVRAGATNLVKAVATDQKAGNLGKFMLPPVTTAAPATVMTMGNGMVNPTTGKALTMTLGKTTGGTQGVNFSNLTSQGATVAGEGAGAAGRVGLMGSNMSALGAAGIGIAANVGGQIIQKRADDKSAYTFTEKERRGNTGGSALASAGTGFGIGATVGSFVPVVGNVVGGLIGAGIGAGIGALKARKENKVAEEEAKRLQREQNDIAAAYQSANVNSSLTGMDTGFGLNSSTNMNNQFTNQYQVARLGGAKKVPGGQIVPIEGTDAVEFKGRSHEKGGVTIDKNTEVEGGETMDQVAMNNNSKQDYIFSKYLKLGGKSFAQRHKEILKGNGSQAEIQQLAAMQEKVAGRDSKQVAAYGGFHKYLDGGVKPCPECPPGTICDVATGACVPDEDSGSGNSYDWNATGVEGFKAKQNAAAPAATTIKQEDTKPAGKMVSQADYDFFIREKNARLANEQNKIAAQNGTSNAPADATASTTPVAETKGRKGEYIFKNAPTKLPIEPTKTFGQEQLEKATAKQEAYDTEGLEAFKDSYGRKYIDPKINNLRKITLPDGTDAYTANKYDPEMGNMNTGWAQRRYTKADGTIGFTDAIDANMGVAQSTLLMVDENGNPTFEKIPNTEERREQESNRYSAVQMGVKFDFNGNIISIPEDISATGLELLKQDGFKIPDSFKRAAPKITDMESLEAAYYADEINLGEYNAKRKEFEAAGASNASTANADQQTVDQTNSSATATDNTETKPADQEDQDWKNYWISKGYVFNAAGERELPAGKKLVVNDDGSEQIVDDTETTSTAGTATYTSPTGITPSSNTQTNTSTDNTADNTTVTGDGFAAPVKRATSTGAAASGTPQTPEEIEAARLANKPRYFMGASRKVDEATGEVTAYTDKPLMGVGAMAGSRLGTTTGTQEALDKVTRNSYDQAWTNKADNLYTKQKDAAGGGLSSSDAIADRDKIAESNWGQKYGYKKGMSADEAKAAHGKFAEDVKSLFANNPDEMMGYFQYIIDGGVNNPKNPGTYLGKDAEQIRNNLKTKGYIDANGQPIAGKVVAGKTMAQYLEDQATNNAVGPIHNALGSFTAERGSTRIKLEKEKEKEKEKTKIPDKYQPCPPGTYRSEDGTCKDLGDVPQGTRINGSLVAGLGQLIPIGAALMNPYKIAPGIVGAPSVKGPLMPRMNLNQERASAIQQNVAYKNAVLGQNAGPASLVAMQSANTKTNQQMMQIAKQEQDTNRQLAAEEGKMGMQASMFNAESQQKTQMFNKEFNQGERRYRREDILGALDSGASRIAGIVKDDRAYKADERLANALDETGSYDRFTILEQLNKEAKRKNSPYYGTTEAERRRMAAAMHRELNPEGYVGKSEYTKLQEEKNRLQKEKEEAEKKNQAKFGGARQYVSRLGQLSGVRATKAKI
jgi:hypothetical protein